MGSERETQIGRQINVLHSRDLTTGARNMSSLNLGTNIVECESSSLIQKAHEIHKVRKVSSAASNRVLEEKTPEKKIINAPISLADRAARIHNDLPEIEEMADKENDTFA